MTFERGGLADKLGNRYEGHWVVKQLLALLDEEIRSVTIEAIGDDERGVDLWIENNNGIRQAQQCKARNASSESWTIGDLNSRGILSYLQFQLNRDPNYQFALVSSLGFELFKDICNFARRSNNNPELFYQNKILAAGKEVQRCFPKFCGSLALDPHNNTDLRKAFDYLKRTDINCIQMTRMPGRNCLAGQVKPVVVFLGWFIETDPKANKSDVWVLNPKALPSYIDNQQ